jgi:hypothetical protein
MRWSRKQGGAFWAVAKPEKSSKKEAADGPICKHVSLCSVVGYVTIN